MRLGFNDTGLMRECALAMAESGACEIVVHARTKLDGYRPPAYWELIPEIRAVVKVPVIANGEIWTVAEALRCRELSGCEDLMLGRGIVADPGLALDIRSALADGQHALEAPALQWVDLAPALHRFWDMVCEGLEPRQRAGRLKQWLNLLRRRFVPAELAYQQVKLMTDQAEISRWLHAHCALESTEKAGETRMLA